MPLIIQGDVQMEWISGDKIPLLVICGPTASGKTAVGAKLASVLGGEVVSADSMQIYKGMEIASAAPTAEEMLGVPHHLVGIIEPGTPFSVADYKKLAADTVSDISARKKLPVLVGGAGLYIDAVTDDLDFDSSASDGTVRRRLEAEAAEKGSAFMMDRLRACDPDAAAKLHENNTVRVIRALELYEVTGRTFDENMKLSRIKGSPYSVCMIGLNFEDRNVLYDRINRRVGIMAENGLEQEERTLYESGCMKTSAQAIGYKELVPYFEGNASFEDCLDEIRKSSRHYAKRQLTWFRRNAQISWINRLENERIDEIIVKCLNIVAKSEIMCYNKK